MKKFKNNKGFTLMEMLIVVAIIAILIAIAIPTFTNQLENAREAADIANIRSTYAVAMAGYLTTDGVDGVWAECEQTMTQKKADWQNTALWPSYLNGGTSVSVANGDTVYVQIDADGVATVTTTEPTTGTKVN